MQDRIVALSLVMIGLFAGFALTGWIRGILVKRAVLDIPNARSSHQVPVPRGGGLALVLVLAPLLFAEVLFLEGDDWHLSIAVAFLLLALTSWLDDRRSISPLIRLGIHILAAMVGSLSFSSHDFLFGGLFPFWLDRVVMVLGWAWFTNVYNFMDGIDGLTGVETISIAMGVFMVMTVAGTQDPFVCVTALVLIGLSLGFLAHNWHPAKIFLGDVGSVPLGYIVGYCLIAIAMKGYAISMVILPLYYLADSGLTIVKRALRGERVWEAHREHFYQKAALGVGSHSKVVSYVIGANVLLIAAAVLATFRPVEGLILGVLIVAILLGKMHISAVQAK